MSTHFIGWTLIIFLNETLVLFMALSIFSPLFYKWYCFYYFLLKIMMFCLRRVFYYFSPFYLERLLTIFFIRMLSSGFKAGVSCQFPYRFSLSSGWGLDIQVAIQSGYSLMFWHCHDDPLDTNKLWLHFAVKLSWLLICYQFICFYVLLS